MTILLGLGVFLSPLNADAACSDPIGQEGEQVYNTSHRSMQFCNGTNWIAMGNVAGPGAGCTAPWGATIAHESDVTAYQDSFHPTACNSETRSCFNTNLSGTFQYETCTVGVPSDCTPPWGGTVLHNNSVTAYENAVEPFGGSCTSETRNCYNGVLDGTFTNQNCTVSNGSCPLPWGGTLANGGSDTAYQVNYIGPGNGASCTGANRETRTCTNGVLSGSFTNETCQKCVNSTYSVSNSADNTNMTTACNQATSGLGSCPGGGSVSTSTNLLPGGVWRCTASRSGCQTTNCTTYN